MTAALALHRVPRVWTRRVAAWCVLLFVETAFAQGDHSQHPLHAETGTTRVGLQRAITLGAQNGPEVIKSRATHAAAQGLGEVAAPFLTQQPYIQTQVGPRLSRGDLSPEVIVSVNQPFSLSDTVGVQKRIARATSLAVGAYSRSSEFVDARRAAEAWIALALAERVLTLRQAFTTESRSLVALARARVTAGEAQPVELALAEAELSDAQSLVMEAEGWHYSAELDLSYAIGAPGTHVDVEGDLGVDPTPPPLRPRRVHPEVLAAESRAALALEQVAYAKVQQTPTLALGVQYQREGTGDQVLTAIATIPFPIARPWAFQQAQQRLASDAARAEVTQARVANDKELSEARHEVHHTRAQYEHLERAGLPPLREAHRLAWLRYSHGATDLTEVSLVRQRLLRAEEHFAEAQARVQRAHVQWSFAAGTLLDGEASP